MINMDTIQKIVTPKKARKMRIKLMIFSFLESDVVWYLDIGASNHVWTQKSLC